MENLDRRILKAIADAIAAEPEKKLLLTKLRGANGVFSSAGIPDGAFEKKGLSKQLEKRFPDDLFIRIANGKDELYYVGADYPEARTEKAAARIAERILREGGPEGMTVSEIADRIREIRPSFFRLFCGSGNPEDRLSGLLRDDPAFKVSDGRYQISGDVPENGSAPASATPSNPPADASEGKLFSRVADLSGWSQAAREFCGKNGIPADLHVFRSAASRAFCRMMLFGGRGLLRGVVNGIPLLAFPFRPVPEDDANDGKNREFFCVLERTEPSGNPAKVWKFRRFFAYPDDADADPAAEWIRKWKQGSGGKVDFVRLKRKASRLDNARKKLLPELEAYLEILRNGTPADSGLSDKIRTYEDGWKDLKDSFAFGRTETIGPEDRIEDLEARFSKSESVHETYFEAVRLFRDYAERVDAFLLNDCGCSTPAGAAKDSALIPSEAGGVDVPALESAAGYYRLFEELNAAEDNGERLRIAQEIEKHFQIGSETFGFLSRFFGTDESKRAFLTGIETVFERIRRYNEEIQSPGGRNGADLSLDTDALWDLRLGQTDKLLNTWTDAVRALLPEDENLRKAVLGAAPVPDSPSEALTPFGAAERLSKAENATETAMESAAGTALKYYILGSYPDPETCGPVLLRLCREKEDGKRFLDVWKAMGGADIAAAEDWVFLLRTCVPEGRLEASFPLLKGAFEKDRTLRDHPDFKAFAKERLEAESGLCAAFRDWLLDSRRLLSEFEQAVAENDMESAAQLASDPEAMRGMGYGPDEEDIRKIADTIREGLQVGETPYYAGLRLRAVQGNRNGAAAGFLWESAVERDNPAALKRLYELYTEAGDFESAVWLTDHMGVPVPEGFRGTLIHARALAVLGCSDKLVSLAEADPRIVHDPSVKAFFLQSEPVSGSGEASYDWKTIAAGIPDPSEPCPFEDALQDGDFEAMRTLVSDETQMEAWGYEKDRIDRIRDWLSKNPESKTADALSRVWNTQKNLHGFYESVLLESADGDPAGFFRRFCRLLHEEERYEELVAVYEKNAPETTDDAIALTYLTALLKTGRTGKLLAEGKNRIRAAAKNGPFMEELEARVQSDPDPVLAELLDLALAQPKNNFEVCLVSFDSLALRTYVSDREKLRAFGYGEEEILRITETYKKPFATAYDRYSAALRIRTFLGSERARPFFAVIRNEDPRAATALFDIYAGLKRFDDQCVLFREQGEDRWNDHYTARYLDALCRAEKSENLKALLEKEGRLPEEKRKEPRTAWGLLRARFGLGQSGEETDTAEERVLSLDGTPEPEFVAGCLDAAWKTDPENAIRFAGRLLERLEGKLPFGLRKLIAGVNGHLTEGESGSAFLEEHGTEAQRFETKALFGIGLTGDAKASFLNSLSDMSGRRAPWEGDYGLWEEYLSAAETCVPSENAGADYLETLCTELILRAEDVRAKTGKPAADPLSGLLERAGSPSLLAKLMAHTASRMETEGEWPSDTGECVFLLLKAADAEAAEHPRAKGNAEMKRAGTTLSETVAGLIVRILESGSEGEPVLRTPGFFDFLCLPFLSNEYAASIIRSLGSRLRDEEPAALLSFYKRVSERLPDLIGEDDFASAAEAFLMLPMGEDSVRTAKVLDLIGTRNWSPERSPELLDALLRSPLKTNSSLYSGLRDLASTLGTDAEYRFCREHIRSVREEGGVPSDDAFGDLLRCASEKADFGPEDGEDAELLRTAVRNRNTPEALRTYQRALASTGREDPAEAVEILLLLNDPDAAEEGVTRTADLFDRLTVGQIENAFPFWRGLVVFSDEDNQMKERFRYIDEDVALGADLKTLAAKMLLSDIYNPLYLKDSLNRSMPFSEYARKKLHYFEYVTYVRRNGTANVKTADAVRNYMKDGEYGLAIGLLKEIVGLPVAVSYTWGQLLGDLYTPETLRACGELTDMVPDVFRWIERMNRSDTNGAWKNTQRAVEIAEMTGTEPSLYETLGQSITRNFSGVAAAVIAELIPKGRLKEAETWLSDALASNPNHSYLKLTEAVLNTARKEGVLSDEDRYLLRTIPSTGNLRTLESYGELVFDACCEGDQTALIGALYRIYSEFEKGQADRALLVALMALSADAEEESVLYGRIREYALSLLSTDAEPDERKAAALAFAAAGVCLNQPEIDDLGTVFPLFDSQGGDREFINQLRSFRRYCDMHLQNGGDRRLLMRTALGRFSAGSLQMDARLIGIIFKVRQTPLLYTCCCAVSDGTVGEKEAYDFLVRAGYGPKSRVVEVLKEIDPGDAPLMRKLSHLPIEVPYVNFHIFRLILEQSTGRESMTALLMFFFAASSYVRDDYRKNLYGFEYLVNSGVRTGKLNLPEDRDFGPVTAVESAFGRLESGISGYPQPSVYADERNYEMLVLASEHYLEKISSNTSLKAKNPNAYAKQTGIMNNYLKFGKLMTRGMTESEFFSGMSLRELCEIAILISESKGACRDLRHLIDLCPPKQKVCLRCVQELIQGNPRNLFYVLQDNAAGYGETHSGTSSRIAALLCQFVDQGVKTKKPIRGLNEQLAEENKQLGRKANWGIVSEEEKPEFSLQLVNKAPIIFRDLTRNPAELVEGFSLGDFRSDIDGYLAEDGIRAAEKAGLPSDAPQGGFSESNPADGSEEFSEGMSSGTAVNPESAPEAVVYIMPEFVLREIRDRRDSLSEKEGPPASEKNGNGSETASGRPDRLDALCERIEKNEDRPEDPRVRADWAELGLILFDRLRLDGRPDLVKDEACDLLKAMAAFVTPDMLELLPGDMLRMAIHSVLLSADSLEELVQRCQTWMSNLCECIFETDKRKCYRKHVKFVRNVGIRLSGLKITEERVDYLEKTIDLCGKDKNPIGRELKQSLLNMLNDELRRYRNRGRLTMKVYTAEITGSDCPLSGMVQNLGEKAATDVRLEFRVNDVSVSDVSIPSIDGGVDVPFEFFIPEEVLNGGKKNNQEQGDKQDRKDKEIRYALVLRYFADEEEEIGYAGQVLRSERREVKPNYSFFQVQRPDLSEYTDRVAIQSRLEALYPQGGNVAMLPSLAVYGMRRMGKSWLLNWIQDYLEKTYGNAVLVVKTSLEGASAGRPTLTDRAHFCLVKKVLEDLDLRVSDRDGEAWKEFRNKWLDAPEDSVRFEWIPNFFRELNHRFLNGAGIHLMLILDEVERLYLDFNENEPADGTDGNPEVREDGFTDLTRQTNFWDELGVALQDETHGISLILCGADPFTNTVMGGDNLTQFFQKSVEKISVGRMTKTEMETSLRMLEGRSDLKYEDDAIEYLWALTSGLPWHTKKIVNEAVWRLIREKERRVTLFPSDMLDAAQKCAEEEDFMSARTLGMDAPGRDESVFLNLLADRSDSAKSLVRRTELLEAFRKQTGDEDAEKRFDAVLKMLVEGRQLVLPQKDEQGYAYRFGSEFNRLFVRHAELPGFLAKN